MGQGQGVTEPDGFVTGAVWEQTIEGGGTRDAGRQSPLGRLEQKLDKIRPTARLAEEDGHLGHRHEAAWLVDLLAPCPALALALALAPARALARTRTRTLALAPARCLFLTSAPAERRQCSALVERSTSSAPAERNGSTCRGFTCRAS